MKKGDLKFNHHNRTVAQNFLCNLALGAVVIAFAVASCNAANYGLEGHCSLRY